MKYHLLVWLLATGSMAHAADPPPWVERLAFWAAPELRALKDEIDRMDLELARLSPIVSVNSGNRSGFQTAGKTEGQDLQVEVELAAAFPVDSVVLVPLLARGAGGQVPGFGFPRRFLLEGIDADGETVILMDETAQDFPNPGPYPVSAVCRTGTVLQRIRLTATEPWENESPPVLALAELLVLHGNRNLTAKAKVRSSSSREIPPTWARTNLVDMTMPLGLPLAPGETPVIGWHGPVTTSMDQPQAVTVDLGRAVQLDEIRLVPAWRSSMVWDSYYGFPIRFKVETALEMDFRDAVMIHDRTGSSLMSPGQNLQCYSGGASPARYVRVTATRLRDHSGNFVFALGELQAYAADKNVARGAPVMAEASLENAEWNPAGLTDGSSGGGTLLELPEWIRQLEQRRVLEQQRESRVQRRRQLFVSAEHTLVGTSIGGAGGIALLAGLFSWRGHRQQALDRERHRERLARDLHDELGSNLGSIALISSFAAQEEEAQMRLDLAEIERVARESADSMRDMVSLLGGKRGGAAADWLKVMADLAERLLRGVNVECRLPTAPLTWEPNLETRRELYLFCKEVLHNAAKHAHASRVQFQLSPTPGGLRILIADDGRGFDPGHVVSGHGLGNLRERATMLRAVLTLTTAPGTGTTVLLEVPRQRRWTKR
ncbi:MAG: histidine kinase [Verrucomicrobiota bacterium]